MFLNTDVLFVTLLEFTRFTWRMKILSGRRGVAILYAYMFLGLGFLRAVSPDFGDLANQEQELEGTFRFCNTYFIEHSQSSLSYHLKSFKVLTL